MQWNEQALAKVYPGYYPALAILTLGTFWTESIFQLVSLNSRFLFKSIVNQHWTPCIGVRLCPCSGSDNSWDAAISVYLCPAPWDCEPLAGGKTLKLIVQGVEVIAYNWGHYLLHLSDVQGCWIGLCLTNWSTGPFNYLVQRIVLF